MNVRLFILSFCAMALLMSCNSDCSLREQQIPEAPIYPGSILTVEGDIQDELSFKIMSYRYSVNADMDSVVDFFDEISGCRVENFADRVVCHGDADPFGVYEVFINFEPDGEMITYAVVLSWNKCGNFDPDINVE